MEQENLTKQEIEMRILIIIKSMELINETLKVIKPTDDDLENTLVKLHGEAMLELWRNEYEELIERIPGDMVHINIEIDKDEFNEILKNEVETMSKTAFEVMEKHIAECEINEEGEGEKHK